ncbi:hypothetical protein J3336_11140 [Leuconostoc mesenteroides]|uniref:hypothetical protein n=1 Tax=Leuconostoc mesenteroides TaxID=1245 RepID=UPI001CC0319E|nr:hypothetical protein [Leuconostoc mesenteroides]MBZ1523973.1 hypothetical protein [Leuconostoc mesenteroides]
MDDVKNLSSVYWVNMLSNKFVFIFNLVIPTIYFLYININSFMRDSVTFNHETFKVIGYFWAYIILVTILNNVIVGMISQRESGFYKQTFFIVGSKYKILGANFLVQLLVLNIELLIINFVVMFTAHYWSIKLLLAGIMASIVVSLPIAFAGSILFMLKIKIESINILVSILLFGLFIGMHVPNNRENLITTFTSLINPLSYITEVSYQVLLFLFNAKLYYSEIVVCLLVTLIYVLIGWYSISKLSVNAVADRV